MDSKGANNKFNHQISFARIHSKYRSNDGIFPKEGTNRIREVGKWM